MAYDDTQFTVPPPDVAVLTPAAQQAVREIVREELRAQGTTMRQASADPGSPFTYRGGPPYDGQFANTPEQLGDADLVRMGRLLAK